MKKFGFLLFISALTVGLISAANCSVGNFNIKNVSGVQGSGNAKQETRNVSSFSKIEVGNAINAEVTVGSAYNVSVEADDNLLSHVKTEVNGDTLKIYTEDSISTKTNINVKISMPELKKIDASGASKVNITGVTADSLELKASGASKVTVAGEAKNLKADASGASTINAENLKATKADVDSNGASKIIVSALDELNAEASGASSVTYTGDPKSIKQDASGASSINKK